MSSPDFNYADAILPPLSFAGPPVVGVRYIIATSQRTGSTLLTDALTGTGIAGAPEEYFLKATHGDDFLKRRFGVREDAEYIGRLIAATATPNGVFGFKLFWGQWDGLVPKLMAAAGGSSQGPLHEALPGLLQAALGSPRYVWLRRRDKVAQAVSLYRASRTGIWRAQAGRNDQECVADRELVFDFDQIHASVQRLEQADWNWDAYFRSYRLRPLMLFYEEFVTHYEMTVQGVLKFLGLPHEDAAIPPPKLERQADERSREWETLYREMSARAKKEFVLEGVQEGEIIK